jgi:hypothetical protein
VSLEQQGGRPRGELTPFQQRSGQPAESQQGRAADSPWAPILREQQSGEERSHEEMVAGIRREMAEYVERVRPSKFDPVDWMRYQLTSQTAKHTLEITHKNRTRQESPHAMVLFAWDVISEPYYTNDHTRRLAKLCFQDDARVHGNIITLNPQESKLLEVMTDACGFPMRYGRVTVKGHDGPYTFEIRKQQARHHE